MKSLTTARLEADACSTGIDELIDGAGRLAAEREADLLLEAERERDREVAALAARARAGLEARKRTMRKTIALPDALFDELEKAAIIAKSSAQEVAIRLLCGALKIREPLKPEQCWPPKNIERRGR